MTSDTIVKIILPILTAIASAIITYFVTRKQKIDDVTIKRGIDVAEKLALTVQDIMKDEEYFYETYKRNYGHVADMEEAVHNFERMESLYSNDYERIRKLAENRKQAIDDLKIARLYLNNIIVEDIQAYVNIGLFSFTHDGHGMINTYYLDFFKNLMDKNNRLKRVSLSGSIKSDLRKLLK
ncbi:MAG: hypothetical protein ABIN18_06780 [Pseudomonadota bacterium]